MSGRFLAIGDVHGYSKALDALLEAVQPKEEDTLIFLGDYIDRGPDSSGVIERIIQWQQRVPVVALLGNHEEMMVASRLHAGQYREWMSCGGVPTLESYLPLTGEPTLSSVPESHWTFFETCKPWYEIDTHFFVHANAEPQLPLDEQPDYTLRWKSFRDVQPHVSGKIMVCGHTAQRTGMPLNVGYAVCIDTWIYGAGWLTCLDVSTNGYWQSQPSGEVRTGKLIQPQ